MWMQLFILKKMEFDPKGLIKIVKNYLFYI